MRITLDPDSMRLGLAIVSHFTSAAHRLDKTNLRINEPLRLNIRIGENLPTSLGEDFVASAGATMEGQVRQFYDQTRPAPTEASTPSDPMPQPPAFSIPPQETLDFGGSMREFNALKFDKFCACT